MRDRRLEKLLTRYRDRHDSAAIGRLFDAVAPELLTVAQHVAGDPAEAEDLVQATFLTVLEHPERHQSGRPVIPWLIGILTREARYWRRQAARTPEPERVLEVDLEREVDARPEARTSAKEVDGIVNATLQRLPELYREVLMRHLHGGTPADIAGELGRTGASVRVQLHRGLAQLRELLPAGVAGGLVIALAPRGLARMRAELMTHASSLPNATAAAGGLALPAAIGTLLVFKKSLLAVISTGLVAWLLYLNFDDGVVYPEFEGEGVFTLVEPEEGEAAGSVAHARDEAENARSMISPASVLTPETIVIDSIIVRTQYANGDAAPNVNFELTRFMENGSATGTRLHQTDAKGETRVSGLSPGQYGIYGDRVGHTTAQVLRVTLAADAATEELLGQLTPVATLKIPEGHDVAGQVVDTFGKGVAGADIWVSTGLTRRRYVVAAHTDEDGRFALPQLAEECFFGAYASGHRPSKPLSVEHILAEGTGLEVTLPLTGVGTAVRGYVFDPAGDAVAGARVRVGPQDMQNTRGPSGVEGPPPPVEVITNDEGYFSAEGLQPGDVRIAISADGWPVWVGSAFGEEGSSARVEIRLEQGAWVSGQLTDISGHPVPRVGVHTSTMREQGVFGDVSSFRWLESSTDEQGRFRIGPLPPGEVQLIARTDRGSHTATGKFTAIAGQEYEWNLQFKGMPFITGTARAENGTVLSGWTIVANPEMSGGPPPVATRSGKDGKFRLNLLTSGTVRLELYRAEADRPAAPCTWVTGIATGTRDVELFVDPEQEPEGVLRGELLAPSGAASPRSTLTVWHDTFGPIVEQLLPEGATSFEVRALAAGEMTLIIEPVGHEKVRIPDLELEPREERDLGVIELKVSAPR